jgi:hypothetical protein
MHLAENCGTQLGGTLFDQSIHYVTWASAEIPVNKVVILTRDLIYIEDVMPLLNDNTKQAPHIPKSVSRRMRNCPFY